MMRYVETAFAARASRMQTDRTMNRQQTKKVVVCGAVTMQVAEAEAETEVEAEAEQREQAAAGEKTVEESQARRERR